MNIKFLSVFLVLILLLVACQNTEGSTTEEVTEVVLPDFMRTPTVEASPVVVLPTVTPHLRLFTPRATDGPDFDLDGISDVQEQELGTLVYVPDTDGDFLGDGFELLLGTIPVERDTDYDGVLDGLEFLWWGTDPLMVDVDSDGDMLADSVEAIYGTDPNDDDTDDDWADDWVELWFGTNPLVLDTDGDRYLDGSEINQLKMGINLDPLISDVDSNLDGVADRLMIRRNICREPLDSDEDRLCNEDEEDIGTDPFNSDSDGDGYLDGEEFILSDLRIAENLPVGMHPLRFDRDYDGDGLVDLLEMHWRLDPHNPDMDGDGKNDRDELFGRGDPTIPD